MARRLRDKNIETREARAKLKASPNPYWRAIGRGLHLGYRKGKTGGVWVVRKFVGGKEGTSYKYDVRTIAQADDREDANGIEILDFWTAQDRARDERRAGSCPPAGRHVYGRRCGAGLPGTLRGPPIGARPVAHVSAHMFYPPSATHPRQT